MNIPQIPEKTPQGIEILVDRYRSDDGKLSCSSAFKIARKLRVEPLS